MSIVFFLAPDLSISQSRSLKEGPNPKVYLAESTVTREPNFDEAPLRCARQSHRQTGRPLEIECAPSHPELFADVKQAFFNSPVERSIRSPSPHDAGGLTAVLGEQ